MKGTQGSLRQHSSEPVQGFLASHCFPIARTSPGSCKQSERYPFGSTVTFFDWVLECDGQQENTGTGLLNTLPISSHYLDLQVISGAATSAMTSLTNVAPSAPLHSLYHSSRVIKQPADTSQRMPVVSYLPQGQDPRGETESMSRNAARRQVHQQQLTGDDFSNKH